MARRASVFETKWAASPIEEESRQAASFPDIESQLPKRFDLSEMGFLDKVTGAVFGQRNPFSKKATPSQNIAWLLDNTAFRPAGSGNRAAEPWQAEFVACLFDKGRKDISAAVAKVADLIGADGQVGLDAEARKRIEERIEPFVWGISPARTLDVQIPGTVVSSFLPIRPYPTNFQWSIAPSNKY